jgi:GPI mannosyltransferase 3
MIICYVTAHSWSEHKEFRFLLPVLPLFCLLCAHRLRELTINVPRAKVSAVALLGAALNATALLYLGLLHQRAPVEVNRAILRETSIGKEAAGLMRQSRYRIHYLMGCHSTPLLSHLHTVPIRFDPWFLDCGPVCRADPNVECESNVFARDPHGFIERVYLSECRTGADVADGSCSGPSNVDLLSNFPDFIVCNSKDLGEIKASLSYMGMQEIGRFINGLNGIRVGQLLTVGAESLTNPEVTTMKVLQPSVAISLDEMVLFKRVAE